MIIKTKLLFLIILMFALRVNSNSQSINIVKTDSCFLSIGQVYDLKISGNIIFALTETGLYSLRITSLDTISIMNRLPIYNGLHRFCRIIIKGSYAYIGNGSNGLSVVDISNPDSLKLLIKINNIGNLTELAIKDTVLFALEYNSDKIKLISIKNINNLYLIKTINGSGNWYSIIHSIKIIGNYLFCVGRYSRIWRWNITNPASPQDMTLIDEYWAGHYMQMQYDSLKNYLFIQDDSNYMKTYLVNPSNGLITRVNQPNWVGDATNNPSPRFSFFSNIVYIISHDYYSTFIYDISNINHPVKIASIEPHLCDFYNSTSVEVNNSRCYIGAFNQILSFQLGSSSPSGKLDKRFNFLDIEKKDSILFTANENGGLHIFSVINKSKTQLKKKIKIIPRIDKIDLYDNLLFCIVNDDVTNNPVFIFDVSNPYQPALIGTLKVPWKYPGSNQFCLIKKILIKNNHAYVMYYYPIGYNDPSHEEKGIAVFNISNPSNPILITKISSLGRIEDAILLNDKLITIERRYYAHDVSRYEGWNGVSVYSIQNPSYPHRIEQQQLQNYPISISNSPNRLYVLTGQYYSSSEPSNNTITILNLSNLNVSKILPLNFIPFHIVYNKGLLFVSNLSNELNIYNLDYNDNLMLLSSNIFSWDTGKFVIDSNFIYLCNKYTLVTMIINLSTNTNYLMDNQEDILVGSYPNPFNNETKVSFKLKTKSRVNIKIYNLLGQLVYDLYDGNLEIGKHEILWDGLDKKGAVVTSGIYFATISIEYEYFNRINKKIITHKLLLMK